MKTTITYGITMEFYTLGQESRQSFGIAAYADAEKDGTATIVKSIHDITTNEQSLRELVDQCNRLCLSLVHLPEVVEDYLNT